MRFDHGIDAEGDATTDAAPDAEAQAEARGGGDAGPDPDSFARTDTHRAAGRHRRDGQ
jgi:hypothetical protein